MWHYRLLWQPGDVLRDWDALNSAGHQLAVQPSHLFTAALGGVSLVTGITPETIFVVLQFAAFTAAAVGVWAYVVWLTGSTPAGVVAGLAFAFIPANVGLSTDTLEISLMLAALPWALVCYEQSKTPLTPSRWRWAFALGGTVAFIEATSPYIVTAAMFLLPYVVLREIALTVRSGLPKLRRSLETMLISVAVALGLTIPVWLPQIIEVPRLGVGLELTRGRPYFRAAFFLEAVGKLLRDRVLTPDPFRTPSRRF